MDELVTWLREQIAEEKAFALGLRNESGTNVPLQRAEAHEAILDLHPRLRANGMPAWCGECSGQEESVDFPCPTLRALALAYQHRPGYREEWRP